MNKTYGCATLTYKEGTTDAKRFSDKILLKMIGNGMVRLSSYKEIIVKNKTNEKAGAFLNIYGNKFIVKFLEWFTELRGKGLKWVDVKFDIHQW